MSVKKGGRFWSACVCLDPEWPVSRNGSVWWQEVAQAHQAWWMGNSYGKCLTEQDDE